MSENVIATHGLPLSVALNFRVNGRDVLVPMAVEEPSVVAAASNAARLVRAARRLHRRSRPAGHDRAGPARRRARRPSGAAARLLAHRAALLAAGDAAIPRMVARGGGCRDLEVRVLDAELGVVVVHVYVDVGDAMGANMVDTVAEAMAPAVQAIAGGTRRAAHPDQPAAAPHGARARRGRREALGGAARRRRHRAREPLRRARSLPRRHPQQGHHERHRRRRGRARPGLARHRGRRPRLRRACAGATGRWHLARTGDGLVGAVELPLAVGTVGGCDPRPPGRARRASSWCARGARASWRWCWPRPGWRSNLAALRALAGEGIQHGHMRLHERKREVPVGASALGVDGLLPSRAIDARAEAPHERAAAARAPRGGSGAMFDAIAGATTCSTG